MEERECVCEAGGTREVGFRYGKLPWERKRKSGMETSRQAGKQASKQASKQTKPSGGVGGEDP